MTGHTYIGIQGYRGDTRDTGNKEIQGQEYYQTLLNNEYI